MPMTGFEPWISSIGSATPLPTAPQPLPISMQSLISEKDENLNRIRAHKDRQRLYTEIENVNQ